MRGAQRRRRISGPHVNGNENACCAAPVPTKAPARGGGLDAVLGLQPPTRPFTKACDGNRVVPEGALRVRSADSCES